MRKTEVYYVNHVTCNFKYNILAVVLLMITTYLYKSLRIEKTRTSNLIMNHEQTQIVCRVLFVSIKKRWICMTTNCKTSITNIYFGFCSRIVKGIFGLYSLPDLPKSKYSNCTRDSSSKQVKFKFHYIWLKTYLMFELFYSNRIVL